MMPVTWKVSPRAVSCDLGDQAAILDTGSNAYYLLEGSGPFLWGLLEAGTSLDELVATTVRQFGAPPSVVRQDIGEWLASMHEAGLVVAAEM